MKKIFSFVASISLLISAFTFNSFTVTGCIFGSNKVENNHSYNASLLRWKLTASQFDFVKKYENKVHAPASTNSIKEFDDLYDNNLHARNVIWSNYDALQNALNNTVIGNKIDVNWTKMYQNVGLDANNLQAAQQHLLRFYNIFAQVYGRDNVLRLIQKVAPVPIAEQENTVAWTTFNPNYLCQEMGYGPDFANKNLINKQYQAGFWSSNDIISVSTHEYGHALSNFLGLDIYKRQQLNTNFNCNNFDYNNLSTQISHNIPRTIIPIGNKINKKQISNRTKYLIDFLGQEAHISDNQQKLLFGLVVVDSNYGRSAFNNIFNPQLEDEYFAESMASWMLTPSNKRNWGWELKNKFFLHYLPTTAL